jgi:hypothetical protein
MSGEANEKLYEKKLSASEIKHKFIVIRKEASSFFPEPGIPFTIKDGHKVYRVSRDSYNRIFRYMSSWFRDHPELKPGDRVEFRKSKEDDVDFLIFVKISQKRLREKEKRLKEKEEEDYDFNHNEIVDKIQEIGSWLGFESEKGAKVGPRASVDVLWRVKIGNLGEIRYAFEVQRRGSLDSAFLNLIKALKHKATQKIITVATPAKLKGIKSEISEYPFGLSSSFSFIDVKSIDRAWELYREFNTILVDMDVLQI